MLREKINVIIAIMLCSLIGIKAARGAELVDRIVAVVNNEVITLSELKDHAVKFNLNPEDPKVLKDGLEDLIEQTILYQQARKFGVKVTDRDVDIAIEGVKKQFRLNDKDLGEALKERNVTMADFRRQWKRQLLNQKIMRRLIGTKVAVTEDEIVKEYENKYGKISKETQTEISHILIKVEGSRSDEEARRLAENLFERANSGENFAKLAKKYSEDPNSTDKGGDLGFFKKGELAAPLQKVIDKTKEGEVVGPVKSTAGYHIIKVIKRTKSGEMAMDKTLEDEIRQQIYKRRVEKTLKRWIKEVKETAYIERKL